MTRRVIQGVGEHQPVWFPRGSLECAECADPWPCWVVQLTVDELGRIADVMLDLSVETVALTVIRDRAESLRRGFLPQEP